MEKKKVLALALCALLSADALAACGNYASGSGNKSSSSSKKTTASIKKGTGADNSLYPTPDGVELKAASYNSAAPDWSEYDKLVKKISTESDMKKRVSLMHQAEDILMETGAVVPIYYYNDLYLQKTDVKGIYSSVYGYKYFYKAQAPRDVLKINLASEPNKIDPALNSTVDGACLNCNMYMGLYTYDEDGKLVPGVCDPSNPYEVSDDKLTYTFHLRSGLKWSNGDAFTAKDFVYSWNRAASPETASDYQYMFDCIARQSDGTTLDVSAPDDNTFVVKLASPTAYFLDLTAFGTYLPVYQKDVEKYSDWKTNPGHFAQDAGYVTNGAYTMKSWNHNESMVLTKNDNFYDASSVSVKELDFMLSADDTAIYAAYQAGDLDFADTVPTNEIKSLKGKDDFHVVDNLGTYYTAFNVNSDLFKGKTVEQAVAMRKALAILVDRQYIVDSIAQTDQKVATSMIPYGMSDGNGGEFKTNSSDYTFPVKDSTGYYPEELSDDAQAVARTLLEFAGYKFTKQGKLDSSTPLNITYLINDSSAHKAVAEAIQQDFAKIGVNVSIKTEDWNVFVDDRKAGKFDFAREGWLADFNDPINYLSMFTSDSGNNDPQLGVDPSKAK